MTHFHKMVTLSTLTVFVASAMILAPTASAQTSTASASPSAELRQVIKERIEQTIQSRKQPDLAVFLGTLGTITKVNQATFVLVDTLGRERTIELTPETTLLNNDKPIALQDITINSGAVVMGQAADDIVIQARRVLISSETYAETREISLGTIQGVEKNVLSLTTRNTQETISAPLTRESELEDSVGNAVAQKNIRPNTSALIITELDTNGDRYIKRLRLLAPVEPTAQPENDES